jgi:hypothetical protein
MDNPNRKPPSPLRWKGLTAALAFAALPCLAAPIAIDNYTYGVQGLQWHLLDIDFSKDPTSPEPGHLSYKSWSSPDGTGSVRFMDIKLRNNTGGSCYYYRFNTYPGIPAADWKLWANTGTASAPVWVKLSDDAYGLTPSARVWIEGSASESPIRLRLSAYNTADVNNLGEMQMHVQITTNISKTTCTAGGSVEGGLEINGSTAKLIYQGP